MTDSPRTDSHIRNKHMSKKSGPHPIDIHVGERLRAIRILRGLSQKKLGQRMELTFQQIQKYERGTNRIAASQIYEFADILEISVLDFYEGLDSTRPTTDITRLGKDEIAWLEALNKLPSPKIRKILHTLVRAISDEFIS